MAMAMERQNSSINNGGKLKLLVSYGGRIVSRPTDRQLSYIGGDTKILSIDRRAKFSEIAGKLNSLSNGNDNSEICVKYQLPGEDLDALVSLIDDEDVEHMVVEYDRMQRISAKPARLRLFLFDIHAPSPQAKSVPDTPPSNPDYLFGFDEEYKPNVGPPLDLLQIPGVDLPHQYTDNHVPIGIANETATSAVSPSTYRIPVVSTGGMYQTGAFPYSLVPAMGNGNWEQPVYVVPIIPSLPEQKKIGS